ncbi:family 78 glycoside hydrolase catalytic domain [Paenibacillus sp. HJGM_3]|uniref:family 78 glycoside hydrolase catalytic domain n=1 Tax=Paenibacillus sp. HJGM_3 TaxID=3379816 RepID=UPI00385C582B
MSEQTSNTIVQQSERLPGWQADWIWGTGPDSPRNEWRCFRKSYSLPPQPGTAGSVNSASVRITADSRYVLYVNGTLVGRGPVRSWPFELRYDEYEIGHLLRPGDDNVIAVLVMHYGVSTFQYLRGRGGLLVQVDPGAGCSHTSDIVSDGSWKTAVHAGHDANSSRISCQLPFTEIYDARTWDEDWVNPGFDDSGWAPARVIGPAGIKPWVKLVERDIPYLTEEPIYPSRVESLAAVRPAAWTAVFDVRGLLQPESADHANNVIFTAYMATVIRLAEPVSFTIGIVDEGRVPAKISLNGTWYGREAFTGEVPERYLKVELEAGDHFLLLDVSAHCHGHGFHLGFDCDAPFVLVNPLGNQATDSDVPRTAFAALGPFDWVEVIDHQEQRELQSDPAYEQARTLASAEELVGFGAWIKPVEQAYLNSTDVFGACVWKTAEMTYPVPYDLQNAVIAGPNAAVIPVYEGLDTEFVIDFGRELSGYVTFDVDAAEGTIVDMYGFEYMRDGWKQITYQLDNTLRYVCREGRQTYTSFVRRGLRYLMVTIRNAARPVKLYEAHMRQSNFPVAEIGKFHCSDANLNEIWNISRHTTKLCMEDTFVDCPAFEQAYWVGDARNEALVGYYVYGVKSIVERCLRLVPGSEFQTPLYADQVPSGWNSVIPNWTFFWTSACYEYYVYSGDQAFAEAIWPHIRLTLDAYLLKLDERGLLNMKGWNLLDWAPFEQPRDGVVTPQNMFFVRALRHAAQLAAATSHAEEAERYGSVAERLRDAIDTHLWDDARQAYVDCVYPDGRLSGTISMQTQVTACLCGIPRGERLALLERYVLEPPSAFVQIGSPFMSFFYYETLASMGRYDVLVDDIRTQYGAMLEHEATTCWEMYPASGKFYNEKMQTRSHCHAWSAGPAYFLGAYVLGVRSSTPGWTKVTVAPQPVGLAWARGTVPLPSGGRIDVSWRADAASRRFQLRVSAPRGLELDIQAPEGYELSLERVELG